MISTYYVNNENVEKRMQIPRVLSLSEIAN